MRTLLYLDDMRNPRDFDKDIEITVVRTYNEFVTAVKDKRFDCYSFDYHLSEEDYRNKKNGMSCLMYLLEAGIYDWEVDEFPIIESHSSDGHAVIEMMKYLEVVKKYFAG